MPTNRSASDESRPGAPVLKIAIVEDQREIREGLAALIDSTEGYRCTGCFRSMEEALAHIGRDLPDVALIDIGLPGMSGTAGTRLLRERYPNATAADPDRLRR